MRSLKGFHRVIAAVVFLVALWTVGSCSQSLGPEAQALSQAQVSNIAVFPHVATLLPSADTQFIAIGVTASGDTGSVVPEWSTTNGGSIDAQGRYVAPATLGRYSVMATLGSHSDTAVVTVSNVPLAGIEVSPPTATVAPGGQAVFQAVGIDANSDTVPVSVSWSASGGTIDQTGTWTAPLAEGSYDIVATTGQFSATAVGTVQGSSPPPPPGPDEPVPQPGDIVYYDETFEGYSSTAELKAVYWARRESGGTINLDTSDAFSGNNSYRIDWAGSGCGGDADVLIERNISPNPTGPELIVRYYLKYQSGYEHTTCGGDHKEFIFFRSAQSTGRITLQMNSAPACPFITSVSPGLPWTMHIGPESGATQPNCDGTVAGWYKQHLADGSGGGADKRPETLADGQWHRLTMRLVKESSVDSGNGSIQLWIDGELVIDHRGSDPANPALGRVYTRTLTLADLIQFQSVINKGTTQPQSRWYDEVRIWRRP